MKVLILSANFGFIDDIRPEKHQTIKTDYKIVDSGCYKGQPDRIRGKLLKVNIPFIDICKEYDYVIWKDASVQVISENFVDYVIDLVELHDIGAVLHPERKTLAEEYDYILSNIDKPYLKARYADYDFHSEIMYMANYLDFQLYNPRLFAVNMKKNPDLLRQFFINWRLMMDETTWFDQTQFSVCLNITKGLGVKDLYWQDLERYCTIHKHTKLI